MFVNLMSTRVRYAETDQMGVVYYGNYPQYFEIGRVEALRSLGLTYKEMEKRGIMLPVLKLEAAASKRPPILNLTSDLESVTSITYDDTLI